MSEAATHHMRRPILVLDGNESTEGRALYVISALRFCLNWLPRVDVRMIDISDENVDLALTVFCWEHGVKISTSDHQGKSPLASADLYAAAGFQSGSHLRLDEAYSLGIPSYVALQYPQGEWFCASTLLRRQAAFNPRVFAAELESILKPWL